MIRVIRAGLLTTIQDLGRLGQQKHGVIVSGAMDPYAHRVANLLVGNPAHQATLELTLVGPTLEFQADAVVSICGGDLQPRVDGYLVPSWTTVIVRKGSIVEFGAAKQGCRAYLAVAGGFDVPDVLGSKSTYLRAHIGGFAGRALRDGDQLKLKRTATSALAAELASTGTIPRHPGVATAPWSVSWAARPFENQHTRVRVIPGPEFHQFSEDSKETFLRDGFTVSPQSDRMGYRLLGHRMALIVAGEMTSEGVTTGTVQVPPDGNPILLMADHQTTGGYPRIAQVATVDIPIVAQLKPGDRIGFQAVTLAEAHHLLRRQARQLDCLAFAIAWKMRNGGWMDASSRFEL